MMNHHQSLLLFEDKNELEYINIKYEIIFLNQFYICNTNYFNNVFENVQFIQMYYFFKKNSK